MQCLQQAAPALLEDGGEDLVLVLEIVVDEAVGDLRFGRDIRDPRLVEALAGKHDDGGLENTIPLLALGFRGGIVVFGLLSCR